LSCDFPWVPPVAYKGVKQKDGSPPLMIVFPTVLSERMPGYF